MYEFQQRYRAAAALNFKDGIGPDQTGCSVPVRTNPTGRADACSNLLEQLAGPLDPRARASVIAPRPFFVYYNFISLILNVTF